MKIDPKQIARMITEDPDEVNPLDNIEDEYEAAPRSVLIDQTDAPAVAIPYNNSAEAVAAFRDRLVALIADPANDRGHTRERLQDYAIDVLNRPSGHMSVAEIPIDALAMGAFGGPELHQDIWIQHEGSQGVWTNFSSADRNSVSGRWGRGGDKPFGAADTRFFPTTNVESGTMVRGRTE
jgi:hypothetical protein